MLDTKKVGIKIASLRKSTGLPQEKLAEMLNITPQAISKWENGHTLPDTAILPVLAQIFGCTIDEIIMPAYAIDEKIEVERPTLLEEQAKQIAKHVIIKLEKGLTNPENIGLDDSTIIQSIYKAHGYIGNCAVHRGKPINTNNVISTSITVTTPLKEIMLTEKIYKNDREIRAYSIIGHYTAVIPQIYYINNEKHILLVEDLDKHCVRGFHFNEDNKFGSIIRVNYLTMLEAVAGFHAVFWENTDAFRQIGLDWRLETNENLLAHIAGMDRDFKKYKDKEKSGNVPKVWNEFENCITNQELEYFPAAIQYLKDEYIKLIDTRFHTGKNITVIHGDLNPGSICLSNTAKRSVRFINLQAIRMGLCTEDLAMFLALHIQPDKQSAMPMLNHYYYCLCQNVTDYTFETFLSDYKIAVAENMFFTIRLINSGIYDFSMRDNSMKAFKTFVLDSK